MSDAIYRFADCRFDSQTMSLTRGGVEVTMQNQTLDLLHFLLRHPNEVLHKDLLLAEVWGNAHLTDSAIAQAVMKVRKAVGDDERTLIRTVHGKGVVLSCAVETQDDAGSLSIAKRNPSRAPRWGLIGLALMLCLGAIALTLQRMADLQPAPTVAAVPSWWIGPIVNSSGDSDLDWVQAGLPKTLRELLSSSGQQDVLTADGLPGQASLSDVRRFVGTDYAMSAILKQQSSRFRLTVTVDSDDAAPTEFELEGPDLAALVRELVQRCIAISTQSSVPNWPQTGVFGNVLVAELYARANHALAANNNDEAIKLLEAALTREPDNLELQVKLLEAQISQIGHAKAVIALELIFDSRPELDTNQKARLLHRIGDSLWYLGDIANARKLLDQARLALDDNATASLRGMVLNSLAAVVQSSGDLDQSWDLVTLALTQFRAARDEYHTSVALTNLAYIADDLGRLDTARQLHTQALAIRLRYKFPELIAASRYGLARIARRSGDFAAASDYLDQTLPVVRSLGLNFDLFDNLEERAEVQREQAQFQASVQTIEEASQLARAADDTLGIAWAQSVRGRVQRAQGDCPAAVQSFQQAIDGMHAAKEDHEAAYATVEMAQTLTRIGDNAAAAELLRSLDDHFPSNSSSNVAIRVEHVRALLHEQPRSRIDALQAALRTARSAGAHDLEAFIAFDLASLFLAEHDLANVESMLAIAQRWSTQSYQTLALQARYLSAKGDTHAASQVLSRLAESFPEFSFAAVAAD